VKDLPDDLAAMETDDLVQQGAIRDELVRPLFRRWPRLSPTEERELKTIHDDRMRIARYLGRLRRNLRRQRN
jgi:hypothetical protein